MGLIFARTEWDSVAAARSITAAVQSDEIREAASVSSFRALCSLAALPITVTRIALSPTIAPAIQPPMSGNGPGAPIRRPKGYSGKIAYEGELGIVIGKRCTNVSPEEADDYIFGYTCINDVTAVDLLNEDPNFAQWCRSKGFDTFSCIGPVIKRNFDWRNANVVTRLDDVERQNYPISDMIFTPAEQVSMISHDMTLMPGDVIACGTSIGVGSIKDGSTVVVSIDGIGALPNQLAAARQLETAA